MKNHLLLWTLGLLTAAFVTAIAARLIDRLLSGWPLARRMALASLATPIVWVAFQALILPIVLANPKVHAGFLRQWPAYLLEVVLQPAMKLWVCGALCAAALTFFQSRSKDVPAMAAARGQMRLRLFSGLCAAAVLLPIAMELWIERGRIAPFYEVVVLGWAFLIGLTPVGAAAFALLRFGGARALRRAGEPLAVIYAIVIAWSASVWHAAVARQPGASAVTGVEISTLVGVFVGWLAIRRGNRAAAAALARSTSRNRARE